jgi:imidazolonepropionase-like amidohydrolase
LTDGAVTVYAGCRVIRGDGAAPIDGAAITVRDGVIESVGTTVPAGADRIDLTGQTVMPTIINPHGHIGYWKSGQVVPENYSRENVLDHLRRLAYYGVSAFLSLGTDRDDTEIGVRDEQRAGKLPNPELALLLTAGDGIVAPTPGNGNSGPHFAADVMNEVTTPEQTREAVRRLAAKRVDVVKVWIDDRRGTRVKLPAELAAVAVEEAHAHGLTAIAHVYYLDDAKDAVAVGVDGLAHLVRTREPDQALLDAILGRDVFQFSSLCIQNAYDPSWLEEPTLAETVPPAVIEEIREQLPTDVASQVADAYAVLEGSFRAFVDAGVRIALSGDTGARGWQIPGFTEHRELEAMVRAGMTPLAAIRAATAVPAQLLGLADRGTIAPGKRADLLVLNGDPLTDITRTRDIARVVIDGTSIDRDLLRAQIGAMQ